MPDVHYKGIHTETNLLLSDAVSFKYIWPYSGHKTLNP